jgi:DNA-binding NtrC family response regulator
MKTTEKIEAISPKSIVLIVDDEPRVCRAYKRTLSHLGWGVITAADPIEAAEFYEAADVVLTDWDMPHGGGARVLQECPKPVVVHSAGAGAPPGALMKAGDIKEVHRALQRALRAVTEEGEKGE